MNVMGLLVVVSNILDRIEADPLKVEVEASAIEPSVKIRLRSKADLDRWAKLEGVKVSHRDQGLYIKDATCHEFSAMYDKPGRRMLVQAFIFPHEPEWEQVNNAGSA